MTLKQRIEEALGAFRGIRTDKVLHSEKYGDFNLRKESDRKRLQKVVIDLYKETDRLSEHDIAQWRMACQQAINVDNPDRKPLYDIFDDVDLDLHLSGAIGQVNGFVKCRSFKLVNDKGEADDEALKYLQQEWFSTLLDYVLESIYWGHSLIELGDVVTDAAGRKSFDGVTLIPRRHVIPEYGRIIRRKVDDWRTGIDYRTAPYSDWLIEAGRKDSLGLYRKAALQTIPKKYALAFWDTFAEMFGIPIRIAKTPERDEGERRKLAGMMEQMGASAWGVFNEGTDIQLVESTRGDAFNVYDKRIERANSELSKLILQQTMTIDDGSSRSQSETHMSVFENLIESYCSNIRIIVNNQVLPKMVRHGFPVAGLSFEWDDPVQYTAEQQTAIEMMVLNNYEVPGSYFEEKYGIPAGERRTQTTVLPGPPKKQGKEEKNAAQGGQPFFD